MAAPHVAGAFAMLWSIAPDARLVELERALACTGVPVSLNNIAKPRIRMTAARNYLNNPPGVRGWGFGNGPQVMAWDEIIGQRDRAGNSLRLRSDGTNSRLVALAPYCVNDVVVAAQIRRTEPDPEPNRAWYSGLVLSAATDDTSMSGIFFQYGVNDFGTGMVQVFATEGADFTGTISGRLLCEEPITGEQRGVPQILGVAKVRNELQFRFNGQRVCRNANLEVDSRFRFGRIGVHMAAPTGAESEGHQINLTRMLAAPLIPRDPVVSATSQGAAVNLTSASKDSVTIDGYATDADWVSGN